MQIDYICLSRVSLDDLARAFQLPRSQEFALLADLNVGGEPEVRHCGGIQEARDDTLGGNPKTAIAGIFSFFTFRGRSYNCDPRFVSTKLNTFQSEGLSQSPGRCAPESLLARRGARSC